MKIKKYALKVASLLLMVFVFASCSKPTNNVESVSTPQPTTNSENVPTPPKIKIVATLFPQYDFAKQIAGDKAEVSLLLPAGAESHSFEPTPEDIININKADIFVYTGEYMEVWAKRIIDSLSNKSITVLDVSKNITLEKQEDHEEEAHKEEAHKEEAHDHEFDPHIWTDPVFAKQMAQNILETLCEKDGANAQYYQQNAKEYIAKLEALDEEFQKIVATANRKQMLFGGRFAMRYFTKRYGIETKSAYDNCSSETEPSVRDIAIIIDEIKAKNIPVIYYEELVDPKIARTISAETEAEMLLFHSAHSVSKQDFDAGITYVQIMQQNAKNLEKGLK